MKKTFVVIWSFILCLEILSATSFAKTKTISSVKKKVVFIDAGHQTHQNIDYEQVGPGSKTKKYKVTGGTHSPYSG